MDDKKPLGVLLLHGYTSSLDTVRGLVPTVERLGLPYRMPTLRGHGTHPRNLRGVTACDWYADASAALDDLLTEARRAVVMGLSMGGVVAINLGIDRAKDLAGVALVAPALSFASPLARFARPLSRVISYTPAPNSFRDPELAKTSTNYKQVESGSFASLYEYGQATMARAGQFELPLLVVYSRRDQIIPQAVIEQFIKSAGTPPAQKKTHLLERSGHEILMDNQREEAYRVIGDWIAGLKA